MSTPPKGRRALIMAAAAGTCAIAAGAGVPAALLVLAPLRATAIGRGRWVRTLRVDQLKENEPKRVAIVSDRRDAWTVEKNVELGSVWLVRRGNEVLAFSAVCPHLGCSINAVGASGQGSSFACPCHTSAFDGDGKRKSGPSPRDMDTMATKIEDGFVAVDFRRFRIGVAEKTET